MRKREFVDDEKDNATDQIENRRSADGDGSYMSKGAPDKADHSGRAAEYRRKLEEQPVVNVPVLGRAK